MYEHLYILSHADVEQRLYYIQHTMKWPDRNKSKSVVLKFKDNLYDAAHNHWILSHSGKLPDKHLYDFVKLYLQDSDSEAVFRAYCYNFFGQEKQFDIFNSIRNKHCSVYGNHARCTHNDIPKTFDILCSIKTIVCSRCLSQIYSLPLSTIRSNVLMILNGIKITVYSEKRIS